MVPAPVSAVPEAQMVQALAQRVARGSALPVAQVALALAQRVARGSALPVGLVREQAQAPQVQAFWLPGVDHSFATPPTPSHGPPPQHHRVLNRRVRKARPHRRRLWGLR